MDGRVVQLYDYRKLEIPDEMLRIQIDEAQVEYNLQMLALRHGTESLEEVVEEGDLVYCQADDRSYPDGRTVLLYTGLHMPGAEMAEKDAIGGKLGTTFVTKLADKTVELTIKKIVRRMSAEVDDAWIKSLGIENVHTVADYKEQVRSRIKNDIMTERKKEVSYYIVTQIQEQSEFVYDEAAIQQYLDDSYESIVEEYKQYGEDISNEDPEDVKSGIFGQIKQGWLAKAFCEAEGLAVDESQAEEDAERMLEMMELTGEATMSKEELVKQELQGLYLTALYTYMEQYAADKIGGFYGND